MLASRRERCRQGLFSVILFAGLWIPLLAQADGINLTAMTFCATNDQGALNVACRQNTFYLDGAWDIAVYEGTIPPPPSVPWLNNPADLGVSINLLPGEERTFVFCVNNFAPGFFGMNLFFDGLQNQSASPQISVFAHTDDDGPSVGDPPAFAVTPASVNTMGWPVFPEVPGSASVTYLNESARTLVELTDFVIYSPDGLGLDLVQPQEPGGLILTAAIDGVPDVVGQFTLSVRTFLLPPSNLVCSRSQDGKTVDLSWTNDGIYDAIKVMRDGAEIVSLGGASTSHTDLNVTPFAHTYQVLASIEGEFRGPRCRVIDPANPEIVLSAMTLFGTNAGGTVRIAERWNTMYLDGAWDLAFHEGPLVDDPLLFDPATFWINDREDMSINISLLEGETRTFSFYNARNATDPNYFGVNLFFDGAQEPGPGAPGISVFALTDEDGPDIGDPPPFEPNAAKNTMGWPVYPEVPGAASLTYTNESAGVHVELTDFVIYSPDSLGLDLVQPQVPGDVVLTAGLDGLPDLVGEFTLSVKVLELRKTFHRGDADQNNALELTDAIQILGYLFLGSTTRVAECEDAADADDNGTIELTDAIRVLGYLFLGTAVIPDPGATESPCGPDPTTDGDLLECLGYDQLNCTAP